MGAVRPVARPVTRVHNPAARIPAKVKTPQESQAQASAAQQQQYEGNNVATGSSPFFTNITRTVSTPGGPLTLSFSAINGKIIPTNILSNVVFNQPINSTQGPLGVTGSASYTYSLQAGKLVPIQTNETGIISYNNIPIANLGKGGAVTVIPTARVTAPQYGVVTGNNQFLGNLLLAPSYANGEFSFNYASFQSSTVTITGNYSAVNPITNKSYLIGYAYPATTSYNQSTGQINFTAVGLYGPGTSPLGPANLFLSPQKAIVPTSTGLSTATITYNVSVSPTASVVNVLSATSNTSVVTTPGFFSSLQAGLSNPLSLFGTTTEYYQVGSTSIYQSAAGQYLNYSPATFSLASGSSSTSNSQASTGAQLPSGLLGYQGLSLSALAGSGIKGGSSTGSINLRTDSTVTRSGTPLSISFGLSSSDIFGSSSNIKFSGISVLSANVGPKVLSYQFNYNPNAPILSNIQNAGKAYLEVPLENLYTSTVSSGLNSFANLYASKVSEPTVSLLTSVTSTKGTVLQNNTAYNTLRNFTVSTYGSVVSTPIGFAALIGSPVSTVRGQVNFGYTVITHPTVLANPNVAGQLTGSVLSSFFLGDVFKGVNDQINPVPKGIPKESAPVISTRAIITEETGTVVTKNAPTTVSEITDPFQQVLINMKQGIIGSIEFRGGQLITYSNGKTVVNIVGISKSITSVTAQGAEQTVLTGGSVKVLVTTTVSSPLRDILGVGPKTYIEEFSLPTPRGTVTATSANPLTMVINYKPVYPGELQNSVFFGEESGGPRAVVGETSILRYTGTHVQGAEYSGLAAVFTRFEKGGEPVFTGKPFFIFENKNLPTFEELVNPKATSPIEKGYTGQSATFRATTSTFKATEPTVPTPTKPTVAGSNLPAVASVSKGTGSSGLATGIQITRTSFATQKLAVDFDYIFTRAQTVTALKTVPSYFVPVPVTTYLTKNLTTYKTIPKFSSTTTTATATTSKVVSSKILDTSKLSTYKTLSLTIPTVKIISAKDITNKTVSTVKITEKFTQTQKVATTQKTVVPFIPSKVPIITPTTISPFLIPGIRLQRKPKIQKTPIIPNISLKYGYVADVAHTSLKIYEKRRAIKLKLGKLAYSRPL